MDSCPADPQDYVKEAVLAAAIFGIQMVWRAATSTCDDWTGCQDVSEMPVLESTQGVAGWVEVDENEWMGL